jgi:hypothetical protein
LVRGHLSKREKKYIKLLFSYSGNVYLGTAKQEKKHVVIIISALLGASLLLAAALCCYMLTRKAVNKGSSPEGMYT